jgi:Mor family transcriptional regulator
MSFRQYSERNREMLRERENGCGLEELARKYGLQRTTVKALLVSERHRRSFEAAPLAQATG